MLAGAAHSKGSLSRFSWLFISFTIAAGVILPLTLIDDWHIRTNWGVAAYFVIAMMASQWKIKIPGIQGVQTVLLFTVIFGLAEITPAETLVTSSVATVLMCTLRTKNR